MIRVVLLKNPLVGYGKFKENRVRIRIVNLKVENEHKIAFWIAKQPSQKLTQKKDMQLKVESDGTSVHTSGGAAKRIRNTTRYQANNTHLTFYVFTTSNDKSKIAFPNYQDAREQVFSNPRNPTQAHPTTTMLVMYGVMCEKEVKSGKRICYNVM